MPLTHIIKRDGRTVPFDQTKITNAIFKAAQAVGGDDRERAQMVSNAVVKTLEECFDTQPPTVEQVQDVVERTLISMGHAKTAKAYILYRDLHGKLRDIRALVDANELIDGYLEKLDWKVNENSNMTYSLQGLNNHIFTAVNSSYWLNRIYPSRIRDAHVSGDIHIHDLYLLAAYCAGFDLEDLLFQGFGGVPGKVEAAPAKHFRTALGQAGNFLYSLQGEVAGAVAFSNFDTLLAPYVYYDKLEYPEVKQAMQEAIFNLNVPTRVGFQCVSQDTEALTWEGWKKYNEIQVGERIATLNTVTEQIEYKPVQQLFVRPYSGVMHHLTNRVNDQLVSPQHMVLHRGFNEDRALRLSTVEDVLKYSSPIPVPLCTEGFTTGEQVDLRWVRLAAYIISAGTWDKFGNGFGRITITQNQEKHPEVFAEIKALLDDLKLVYSENTYAGGFGSATDLRLNAESSRRVVSELWHTNKLEGLKFVPDSILHGNTQVAQEFLCTYLKGDGDSERERTSTVSARIRDGLMQVAINAGQNAIYRTQPPNGRTANVKDLFIVNFLRSRDSFLQEHSQEEYDGVIWCPTTVNGTFVARRNGKTFITGNCPFTNVTMDVVVPKDLADKPVVHGGTVQDMTYSEFQYEMDLINRAFAEVMLEGDAKGQPFSFPVPTYNVTPDFDWDNPAMDGVWEMTAKYGSPYFANFVHSAMLPSDVRSMCCRLRLDLSSLVIRGGGLFGANPSTGSLGVVTLNMPRIGYTAQSEEDFFTKVDALMDVAKESLLLKREVVEDLTKKGLYPYSRHYLQYNAERFGSTWAAHFNTIGLLGMSEACLNFMGKDLTHPEARAFAVRVLQHMNERLLAYQQETGLLWNLEATPGEGTSYRFALLDKAAYPAIQTAGGEGEPYYTNSTQLPVDATDDVFQALEWQDELQSLYTGGTVFHTFLGERAATAGSVKRLVRKIAEGYRIPYFTLTPTFSVCPDHGYLNGEHFTCPTCQKPSQVYSRVVGYIRPVQQWNKGKQSEWKERKPFAEPEEVKA